MGHDATKVLMGTTQSSFKHVDNMAGDPATFPAGTVLCLKSDNTLSKATADGSRFAISLGRSLSDTKRVALVRSGLRVPILLTGGFTPTIGATVAVSNTTGLAKGYTGTGDGYINAVYASGALTSINEDGTETEANVALIDMPGGV